MRRFLPRGKNTKKNKTGKKLTLQVQPVATVGHRLLLRAPRRRSASGPPFVRLLSDHLRTILGPPSDHPRTKKL